MTLGHTFSRCVITARYPLLTSWLRGCFGWYFSTHLLQEHGIATAHQLKDAVPADCADSEDCPSILSALMNNANGSEITQNGLRFLQKEYDEKGMTHPDDKDDDEAGEFTATKIGKKKDKKAKKAKKQQRDKEKKESAQQDRQGAGQAADPGNSASRLPADESSLTPEQRQEKDLYVPPSVSLL